MDRHFQRVFFVIWITGFLIIPAFSNALAAPLKNLFSSDMPDNLIFLDTDSLTQYAIFVEKETQSLVLYGFDGKYKKIFSMKCSTGEVTGPKTRSGDKKTPEGVYFFTKEHEKKDLSPIYGTRAFPIDYPNVMDRISGNGGNAIWLHGTNKPLKPNDSNGCIVLKNSDINKLRKYITLNRTPLVIVDRLSYASADAAGKIRKMIFELLTARDNAIETGTYHDYLKWYDAAYVPDIAWWRDWQTIRKDLAKKGVKMSIERDRTAVFRHHDVYTVLFDQMIRSEGKKIYAGTRKLFLSSHEGRFRIVGQAYQALPELPKQKPSVDPLVAVCRQLKPPEPVAQAASEKPPIQQKVQKKPGDHSRDITLLVDGWLQAWSSKDIKKFGSYYAKDFRSQGGANLNSWLAYKASLNSKYTFIKITRKKLKIKPDRKRMVVSFVQTYTSDRYSAVGIKRLLLKREGNRWKIYRESWRRI